MMTDLQTILDAGKVIPVLAYNSIDEALKTSRTLYDAGIRVFEITLRHPIALEAITAVISDLPDDAHVGVGTIINPKLLDASMATGARFGVSPGLTPALRDALSHHDWPFLPGVATLSEAMTAHDMGFKVLKFFPASIIGGPDFLKAAGAVLPDVQFCPTGGINPGNARTYLALKNIPVVGGSWIVVRGKDGRVDQEKTREQALLLKDL
jgi:2-dehydro-3-deoxyphosphogluconate aldolase/(4S)-4-hydroxy-2-oxoglutarate aldolase